LVQIPAELLTIVSYLTTLGLTQLVLVSLHRFIISPLIKQQHVGPAISLVSFRPDSRQGDRRVHEITD
jgi:hypothetical protein